MLPHLNLMRRYVSLHVPDSAARSAFACQLTVQSACRRDGFYLELIQEMPDIEDIVGAEERRSESSAPSHAS